MKLTVHKFGPHDSHTIFLSFRSEFFMFFFCFCLVFLFFAPQLYHKQKATAIHGTVAKSHFYACFPRIPARLYPPLDFLYHWSLISIRCRCDRARQNFPKGKREMGQTAMSFPFFHYFALTWIRVGYSKWWKKVNCSFTGISTNFLCACVCINNVLLLAYLC